MKIRVFFILGCFLGLMLLSSCRAQKDVRVDEPIGKQELFRAFPKKGDVQDERHGREMRFAYGAINGIDTVPANGVASVHSFEDGTTIVSMQLNIEPAPKGRFYEGWAPGGDGKSQSLGHFVNGFGDARHSLRFESPSDRPFTNEVNEVVVTIEQDDGNTDPGRMVARGSLREIPR